MREIRRILKEETAIPENIDKAMEDCLLYTSRCV